MEIANHNKYLSQKQAEALHRKHVAGAWVRTGASFGIYLTMVLGWVSGTFSDSAFRGMTIIAVLLIMVNPPTLFILKRIKQRAYYEFVSLSINIYETTCFTGLVYFAGGVNAGHMLLVFAGVISYIGVAAPRRITVTVAVIAILEYNLMILLEHFEFIPHQNPNMVYHFSLLDIQTTGIMTTGLLAVVAYAAAITGSALKRNRDNLRRRNLEMDQINNITNLANRTLDLETILNSMCQELTNLFPLKYAAIGLIDQDREQLEVVGFHSPDEGVESHRGFIMPFEGFAATRDVIDSKKPLLLKDADSNPKTEQLHEHFKEIGVRSVLIAPLLSRNIPVGSIAMPAATAEYEFSEIDVNLIQTIANQVSAAINNAQVHARTESALDVAERDLEIGRQIQTGFIPETLPILSGWELSSTFVPARQVAGDFYDAFPVGDEGKFMFLIGDVCDKGVGAALFMVVFRSLIRSFSLARKPNEDTSRYVHSIISTVNNYICDTHDRENMFATLFLGLVDPEKGNLYYVNAGHDVPFMINATGKIKYKLDPTGPAMGLMSDADFEVENLMFDEGDILLSYTDGVIDSRNSTGESFSEEKLISCITQPFSSVLSLVSHVELQIREHIQQTDQFDDIAILCVRRDLKNQPRQHAIRSTSKLENLPLLRQFIEKASKELDVPESETFSFKLSLDEIFTNICTHGYPEDAPGPVKLSLMSDDGKVVLTIEDQGKTFDSSEIPEVDQDEDLDDRAIGGLGLFLVGEMMDSVEYERTNDGKNRTVLIKAYEEGATNGD